MTGIGEIILYALGGLWVGGASLAVAWWFNIGRHP